MITQKQLPIPKSYILNLTPNDWSTGQPFENCVVETIVLREFGTILENCTYSELYPFLVNTVLCKTTPKTTNERRLFPKFTKKLIQSNKEYITNFFKEKSNKVIEVNESNKSMVYELALRGVIYTSKQTSAGDVYKFEDGNMYISWQIKSGFTRKFGPSSFCDEVNKAILHDLSNTNIKFVLVFVVQQLSDYFTRTDRCNEPNCIEIISKDNQKLGIQFNPGYIMKIQRKSKSGDNTQPKKRKLVTEKKDDKMKDKKIKDKEKSKKKHMSSL